MKHAQNEIVFHPTQQGHTWFGCGKWRGRLLVWCLSGLFIVCHWQVTAQATQASLDTGSASGLAENEQVGQASSPAFPPLLFVRNQGQWASDILYRADLPGNGQLFIRSSGIAITVLNPDDIQAIAQDSSSRRKSVDKPYCRQRRTGSHGFPHWKQRRRNGAAIPDANFIFRPTRNMDGTRADV